VLALLLRALASTWRIRFEGPEPWLAADARLGALWHRNLIVAAGVFRDRPLHVTVSRSRDGDLAVATMQHLGFAEPPRGSSRTGAVSLLRETSRLVEAGGQVIVPVDGPVGPPRRSKRGVLQVAQRAQTPIYTVALSARPCLRFRSWDRMLLPLPFARVVCRYGEPFEVPATLQRGELESLRTELDAHLDALTDAADTAVGLAPEPERLSGSLGSRGGPSQDPDLPG
jgi:lysophospholipid acyltransferase (LPLAT)-like uncharacterized protein